MVLYSIQSAKASHAKPPSISLRRETQALHLITRIPLIQRREKLRSREEKSTFTQWFSSVYARSLKDQARKSKDPRTQILEPRTQSKHFYHSSATFYPYVEQQPNRGHFTKAIQLSSPSYIALPTLPYIPIRAPHTYFSPQALCLARVHYIYRRGAEHQFHSHTVRMRQKLRLRHHPKALQKDIVSTYIGRWVDLYRLLMRPIQVNPATNIGSHHPLYEGLENNPIRDLFPTQLMHLVIIIIGVTDEAQQIHSQTTIGLHTNDY